MRSFSNALKEFVNLVVNELLSSFHPCMDNAKAKSMLTMPSRTRSHLIARLDNCNVSNQECLLKKVHVIKTDNIALVNLGF